MIPETPLTAEERRVLVEKPFPTVRIWPGRTFGGYELPESDPEVMRRERDSRVSFRGRRKPSLSEYEGE